MKPVFNSSFWGIVKRSLWINLAFAGIAGFLVYEAIVIVRQAGVARRELAEQDRKMQELREVKARLEAAIAQLETPEGVEREAKKRLNLKNFGEEVVVVVPDEKPGDSFPPPLPWWKRMFNWLQRMFYGS